MRLDWITPEDIAVRVYYTRPHWFDGAPKASIRGEDNQFGELVFTFPEDEFALRLRIQDREEILKRAQVAIDNFSDIINEVWRREQN